MSRRNFVIRTIVNGRARILGRWFVPDKTHMKYDGRLDGLRYAFGLYWRYNDKNEPENYMCALWGTEKMYRAINNEGEFERLYQQAPDVVNGTVPWLFWCPVENGKKVLGVDQLERLMWGAFWDLVERDKDFRDFAMPSEIICAMAERVHEYLPEVEDGEGENQLECT